MYFFIYLQKWFYGENFASLSLDDLNSFDKLNEIKVTEYKGDICIVFIINLAKDRLINVENPLKLYEILNKGKINDEKILKDSNRFSIDINPRLVYSKSKTIDGLINTGVSQTIEFQLIEEIYILENDKPESVYL